MSDEPKQPPLRLKPRLRPESDAAESSSAEEKPAVAPETPTEPAAEAKPKLRLKPRLAAEPEAASEKQSDPEPPQVAATPAEKPADEAPTPIRLKPRLAAAPESKEEEVAPTPEAASPVQEVPKKEEAGEDKPKFRLKPRLAAQSETSSAKDEQPPAPAEKKDEAPAPVSPLPLEKPADSEAPVEPAAAKAPPKFKLKKKNPEPTPGSTTDSASGAPAVPPKVEGKPAVDGEDKPSKAMPPHPLVHLKASEDLDEDDVLLTDDDDEAPAPKKGNKVLVGLVVLIVLGGGYFGWQQFGSHETEPTVPPTSATPVATPKKPATSLPGQLIEKAQSALDARRQGEQDRVDAAIDGKEIPESQFKRIVKAPIPEPELEPEPVAERVTTQSQSTIAPGVTATTTTVMSAIEASPAFRAFVGQIRINGVFQGSPARALLNGHTYREGELVDPALGIYFDHVVPEKKLIVFRDSSAAIVQRKY